MARRKQPIDNASRSIVKAITFRITIIIADTIITYTLTRRYDLTIGFVVFTNVASSLIYYIHERIWAYITFGHRRK